MKVVFIDWGVVMFRSIFAWEKRQQIPATYTAMTILISSLKLVGIDPQDLIIIAADSPKGSWRKELDKNYKANRKEKREKHNINWTQQFADFWGLLDKIETHTPFHVLVGDKLEADDIIATGCKKFADKPCTIVSSDEDYQMLFAFPNVSIFTPVAKRYKPKIDPYKLLAKKIKKEASDNLITPILNEQDFNIRNTIVNLIELPEHITNQANGLLDMLPDKHAEYYKLPFQSLLKRWDTLYDKSKVVSPDKVKKKKRKVKEVKK
jgi:5'-3' exonuclease